MWEFLSGPFSTVIDKVGDGIDALHTSDEEKAQLRNKLVEAERDFHRTLLENQNEFAKTQARVIQAEVASKTWLASNWRPILMLTFTYIIGHNYVIGPLFGLPTLDIPPDMWDLLQLGIGGYIGGRTAEKILPGAVKAWKNNG